MQVSNWRSASSSASVNGGATGMYLSFRGKLGSHEIPYASEQMESTSGLYQIPSTDSLVQGNRTKALSTKLNGALCKSGARTAMRTIQTMGGGRFQRLSSKRRLGIGGPAGAMRG